MTALDHRPATHRRPLPTDPIYPYALSRGPEYECCAGCWRHHRDMVWIADPAGSGVIYACRSCRPALAAGHPVILPTGHDLIETWERLARLHHNRLIGDEHLDGALAGLAPHLPIEAGRDAVAALQDAMVRMQRAEDPSTVLDGEITGPDDDPETYVTHPQGLADDAMTKLTGGAR